LRNGAARRGRSPEGADDGNARTESGMEKGLQWWKTGDVDAWAMGDECAVLGHGWTRQTACRERKFSAGGRRLCFKGSDGEGAGGEGAGGVGAAWRQSRRERGGAWAWRGAARQHGIGVAVARPWHARAARCRATVESSGVGAIRMAWLTGGPGRGGGAGCQRLGAA
jgi:hypothetical protein